MKINECLEIHFPRRKGKYEPNTTGVLVEMRPDDSNGTFDAVDTVLPLDITETVMRELADCEELSQAASVERYENPFIIDRNGKIIESVNIKVTEDVRFHGRVIIQDISFLENNSYGIRDVYEPVLKGACMTPVTYDPDTFEPKRDIMIRFSPEQVQDGNVDAKSGESDFRRRMHELLDEMLDFPEAFTRLPERFTNIRGYFERVESDFTVSVGNKEVLDFEMDLSEVGDPTERQGEYQIYFFFDNREVDGQMHMGLGKYYVPSEYADAIRNEFGMRVNRQQLVEFMTRNGRRDVIELNDSLKK